MHPNPESLSPPLVSTPDGTGLWATQPLIKPDENACPLWLCDVPMGWLGPEVAQAIGDFARSRVACSGSDFDQSLAVRFDAGKGWEIGTTADDANALAQTLTQLAMTLRNRGLIAGWRDECFSVRRPDGHVWFALERACFRAFGLVSEAVHAHAWCDNGDTWLGRRALSKATDPGKLDNLAAGGLTHGERPDDCMRRELWEEAGVPPEMAVQLRRLPETVLSVRCEPDGLHREVLHCYTLQLPDTFVPCNQDGEVSGFIRCDRPTLLDYVRSVDMTADARLCVDLALRCGEV